MTDAAAMTPMQTIATLLKITASCSGAQRAICCAVLARWSGLGAFMGELYIAKQRSSTTIASLGVRTTLRLDFVSIRVIQPQNRP